jgi:hypothetical protein
MKFLTFMLLLAFIGCASDTDKTKTGLASGQATTISPIVISSDADMIIVDPTGKVWNANPVSIVGIESGLFRIAVTTENPGGKAMVGIRIDGSETVNVILEEGQFSIFHKDAPFEFEIYRVEITKAKSTK